MEPLLSLFMDSRKDIYNRETIAALNFEIHQVSYIIPPPLDKVH